jgi:glycosyltransferase involved in cell wall biosynthesis
MSTASRSRRITVVADELLGYVRTGGIGTATTFLAVALGRMGHDLDILYVADPPTEPLQPEWADLYRRAGVRIRQLDRSDRETDPPFFARLRDVEQALAEDPPDVVIVQDLAALAYTALRQRQLGRGFEQTLFVVYCHGTRRWITDMAGKVRVLPGAHAVSILEQASIELADVAVSPSAYLLDWMRGQRWQLPVRTTVIRYLNRAAATGEPQPITANNDVRPPERLVFFGRLEERKGLRTFAAALDALPVELKQRIEVEFLGRETPAWPRQRVEALLADETRDALRRLTFSTSLDQREALERLQSPATLAVMPSPADNAPNTVSECIEYGIPFVTTNAGGIPELVAHEDRARVLFEPSADALAAKLEEALMSERPWQPARPAFAAAAAYDAWSKVVELEPTALEPAERYETTLVGEADDDVLALLRSAQRASGADVVTCGVRLESGVERYFLGDPGGLGALRNHYGTTALVRSALLPENAATMPRWQLLARLSLEGAAIVSVTEALSDEQPVEDNAAALLVVEEFERHLPRSLRGLARLSAGLAAQATRAAPAKRRRRLFARA